MTSDSSEVIALLAELRSRSALEPITERRLAVAALVIRSEITPPRQTNDTRQMIFTLLGAAKSGEESQFDAVLSVVSVTGTADTIRCLEMPGDLPLIIPCKSLLTLARQEAQIATLSYALVLVGGKSDEGPLQILESCHLLLSYRRVGADEWNYFAFRSGRQHCDALPMPMDEEDGRFIKPGTYEFALCAYGSAHGQQNSYAFAEYIRIELRSDLPVTPTRNIFQALNAWSLPIGSQLVLRKKRDVEFQFHGNLIDDVPSEVGPFSTQVRRTASVLSEKPKTVEPKAPKTVEPQYKRALLDARVYEIPEQKQAPISYNLRASGGTKTPATEEAKFLLDQLYSLCCRSRIRGIPLIQLLNYITFGSNQRLDVAIVGGAVRDILRRVPLQSIKDIDIVVAGVSYFGLVQILNDFFALRGEPLNSAILRCSGTTKKFGMLKIVCNPSTDFDDLDIGLCKTWYPTKFNEEKQDKPLPQPLKLVDSKKGYLYGNSFVHDAALRDYTINAIYVDVSKGLVHDPCGALEHHHRPLATGVVEHTLHSAPYTLALQRAIPENIARELTDLDIGGAFRLYKELQKGTLNPTKFTVSADLQTLSYALVALSKPDELWVRKMARKLFTSSNVDKMCEFLEKEESCLFNLICIVATTIMNEESELSEPSNPFQVSELPSMYPQADDEAAKLLRFALDAQQDARLIEVLHEIANKPHAQSIKGQSLTDILEALTKRAKFYSTSSVPSGCVLHVLEEKGQ